MRVFLFLLLSILLVSQAWALRDPTRPANRAAESLQNSGIFDPGAIELTSTIVSPKRKLAVINGQFLKMGQKMGGATLTDIGKGSVTFMYEGKNYHVNIHTETIRRKSGS